jgi:hypothetical protein
VGLKNKINNMKKNLVINSFIIKDGNVERKNFNLISESTEESVLKSSILEKLSIDYDKWEINKDTFEMILKENVVIYKCFLLKK